MLKLNVNKHALLRNHSDSAAYLRRFGFTHWRSQKISGEKLTSIPFADLEKLCTIFRCTPNDLFEWTPDANDTAADHPLTPLRPENSVDLRINSLSFAQLKEIAKIVGEKK
jgi:DNA-binding Xre family transcriptional regulator